MLLGNLSPVGPNGFCEVITRVTEQLYLQLLLDFRGPVTSRFNASLLARRAPRIRPWASLFRGPVEPNRNTRVQRLRNVLADECLFVPTMNLAIDLLRIAHLLRRGPFS